MVTLIQPRFTQGTLKIEQPDTKGCTVTQGHTVVQGHSVMQGHKVNVL